MNFLCVHPSLKGRLGGPNRADSKLGLRKVGVVRKRKKDNDGKPKRPKKGNKNRCKLCEELGHRIGSTQCRYTPERPKYVNFVVCVLFLILLLFSV